MRKPLPPVASAKPRTSSKLSVLGKIVVLTGTVPGMQRKEAEAKLTGLGARCTGSVSKSTDYVFAMADAGSKRADAERMGIPVLSETILFSLIGNPGAKAKTPRKPVSAEAKAKVAARKPTGAGFTGKTVVITGTLSKERAEIAAVLEAAGAIVTNSVSATSSRVRASERRSSRRLPHLV